MFWTLRRWLLGEAHSGAVISRRRALLLALAAILSLAAGTALYANFAPNVGVVRVELGGGHQPWPPPKGTSAAIAWDFAFIAGYGLALLFGILLARLMFARTYGLSGRRPAIASIAGLLAAITVLSDIVENILILTATSQHPIVPRSGLLDAAAAAATLKFACLIPAAAVAVGALVVTILRIVTHRSDESPPVSTVLPPPVEDEPLPGNAPAPQSGAGRWRQGYLVPGIEEEINQRAAGDETLGLCVSGGGVRSASVALGALQSLRDDLLRARYLVSVSGGGYTAGALLLALSGGEPPVPSDNQQLYEPREVLMPGSVEEDRVRRHVNYIADSGGAMVVALGILARVVVLSLGLLLGVSVVLGVAAGQLYARVPIVKTFPDTVRPWSLNVTFPGVRASTLIMLAVLAAVAFLAYTTTLIMDTYTKRSPDRVRGVANAVMLLLLLVAAFAFIVPCLAYLAALVLSKAQDSHLAIGGSIGSVLLTYVATLVMVGRRHKVGSTVAGLWGKSGKSTVVKAVPTGVLQLVLVVVTLVVLAAGWLLVLGGVATVADRRDAWISALAILAAIIVLGGLLDQTELSLHPFYRRRLAMAFDARRVRRPDNYVVAQGYPYDEQTLLSTYGSAQSSVTFPEVIFAAAANLTGEQRAPLNAASYTFTADWVGGPDVGYMKTAGLEKVLKPRLLRDLTVEAAVAISGAAFASAMGRASRWYGTLLAVSGVRLGSWLPNPRFVGGRPGGDWTYPDLPRLRRLNYLFCEIFGIHRYTNRLLQITDGGHYENLGLVELLRRRCTEIYCIDASGDSPPSATTFAEAIALARAELGVKITFESEETWKLVPGSGKALDPADLLAPLNTRLSEQAVLLGKITYPEESGLGDGHRTGVLVIAKSLLTRDMAYPILSYALNHDVFPHDSTGDQFFDDGKFCAYSQLGREIGQRAAVKMQEARLLMRAVT